MNKKMFVIFHLVAHKLPADRFAANSVLG